MRFDTSGRLIAIVDRNDNTTTLNYTEANLTQITDAVNRSITLDYDSSSRIRQVTDPLGRVWRYTHEVIAIRTLSIVGDDRQIVVKLGMPQ